MISFNHGVELHPLDRTYCEIIRSWRNDPAIYTWCRQSDVITDMEQLTWYDRQAVDQTIKMYAIKTDVDSIRLRKEKSIVGVCGFTSIDRLNQRAEFSLYIAPEYHRKGFARRALTTLFTHGFMNLNLNLIWGETFQGNPAAKLFEEIGMKKEGIRRQFYFKGGRFIDCFLYSVIRYEWGL